MTKRYGSRKSHVDLGVMSDENTEDETRTHRITDWKIKPSNPEMEETRTNKMMWGCWMRGVGVLCGRRAVSMQKMRGGSSVECCA